MKQSTTWQLAGAWLKRGQFCRTPSMNTAQYGVSNTATLFTYVTRLYMFRRSHFDHSQAPKIEQKIVVSKT